MSHDQNGSDEVANTSDVMGFLFRGVAGIL